MHAIFLNNMDTFIVLIFKHILFIFLLMLCHICLADTTSPLKYHQQVFSLGDEKYNVDLPTGYTLEVLTTDLNKPRLLTFLPNNELLIGSKSGSIYRLFPPYTKAETLLKLNDYPHSIAYRNQQLFIAQEHGLYKVHYTPGQQASSLIKPVKIISLPGGGHSSRTISLGPDKRIYLSIGISGNCSDEYLDNSYAFNKRRGGIFVLDESNNNYQLVPYASGLRNPVGFDWHPETGIMFASNNGPDHQGFELPPEYFSRIDKNSFHGMPWFQYNGKAVKRDDCVNSKPPKPSQTVIEPVATFPARNAPMGVAFVPQNYSDNRLSLNAIVALRGSWATRPGGGFLGSQSTRRPPKIVIVRFSKGKALKVDDLLSGFQLPDGDRWARPVGVEIGPDQHIYFTSDSETNGLFRLRFNVKK